MAFTGLLQFRNKLIQQGRYTDAVDELLIKIAAIIQSSSASVGILQGLCSTGVVTYGAAIPIILGQNIGTCITAIMGAIGANRNARRTAMVHLLSMWWVQ